MVSKTPYTAKGHAGVVDGSYVEQFWLDGGGQPVFQNEIVEAGQVLEVNAVLGMVTATSKLVLCDAGAGDGSEVPYAILQENLDTSATGLNADEEISVLVGSNRLINLNALRPHNSWGLKALRVALVRAGFVTRTPVYSAL
jgi:hypothetical protein